MEYKQKATEEEEFMAEDIQLKEKRQELKQEITLGMHALLMGLIFEYTSRLIQKLTRRFVQPPFFYTAISVAVLVQLIQLPGLLVAILLKETHQYSELSMLGSLSVEIAFTGILVAKMNINYVLQNLRDHVIDAIESTKDLDDLGQCLLNFWSLPKHLAFAFCFGVSAGILTAIGVSRSTNYFIGIGFAISATLTWTVAVIPVYYLILMAVLPLRLSRYHYNLFETNPIRSDVLRHLSLTLKNYTYVVAVFIAFATFFYSVNPSTRSLNILVLVLGWIPLTAQFLSNRSSLKIISRNAKWQTLKEVELEIKKIRAHADLAEKETIEAITRLMDYHDRINATQDAALENRARASFFNQILLTILASAIANINSIVNIFVRLITTLWQGLSY